MRILQLVTRRQRRGAEIFASLLNAELAARGNEVLFVGLYTPDTNPLSFDIVRDIDLCGRRFPFNPILFYRLLRLINRFQPDIIQANGSDTLKYAVLTKYFYGKAAIVYRNISMVSGWVNNNWAKKLFNKFLFGHVAAIVSVGEKARQDIINTYALPSQKVRIIKRGLEKIFLDSGKSKEFLQMEFAIPRDSRILLHVGRFSPEKNHKFILQSFKILADSHAGTFLIFAGEGELREEIIKLVMEWGLVDRVIFAGQRSDVSRLMAGSDLLILGSTVEGVPGVIMEAGMQSVPSVAVSVGGVGEIVINNFTGSLVENHDPVEFSRAMAQLLRNEKLRQELGRNARNFFLKEYSMEAAADKFTLLYQELLPAAI